MSTAILQNGHDASNSDNGAPSSPVNGLDSIFRSADPSPSTAVPSKLGSGNLLEETDRRPTAQYKSNADQPTSETENFSDIPETKSINENSGQHYSVASSQSISSIRDHSEGKNDKSANADLNENVLSTGCDRLDKLFSTPSRRMEFVDQLINDILSVRSDTVTGKSTGSADAIADNLKAFVLAVAGADKNIDVLVSKIRTALDMPDQIVIPPSEVVSIMSVRNFEPSESRSVEKPVSDSANSPCFPCPAMTSVLTDIGLNLVMESNSMVMYEKVSRDIAINTQKLKNVSKRLEDLQMGAEPEDSDSDEEAGTIESSKALKTRLEASVKSLTNSKQLLKSSIIRLKDDNRPFKLKLAKCSKCEFKSESLSVMYHHMLHPHKKLNRLECGLCDFRMANFDDLEAHYQTDHSLPCYEYLYPAKLACEFCPQEDFPSKGALKVHMRACASHNPRHMNMAPVEDDLLHINRLFWGLNDSQLRRIQQKMFSRRPTQASQQATRLSSTTRGHGAPVPPMSARPIVAPRSGVSGASGLAARPAELSRQINGAAFHNILPKPNMPGGSLSNFRPRSSISAAVLAAQAAQSSGSPVATNPLQLLSWQRRNAGANPQRGRPPGSSAAAAALMAAARVTAMKATSSSNQSSPATAKLAPGQPWGRPSDSSPKVNSYRCEICDDTLLGFQLYAVHLQMTHNKQVSGDQSAIPPLSCSKCRNQRFYSYEGLERHLLAVHNLVSQELLRKAREKKDAGRCKLCLKDFPNGLVQHCATVHRMPLCTADIVYTCDICKARFTIYSQLESHLATVHRRGVRPAMSQQRNGNSQQAQNASSVQAGARSNQPSNNSVSQAPRIRYNCTPCQLKFASYAEVIEHWRQRHLKRFTVPVCRITECEPCGAKRGLVPDDERDDSEGEGPATKRAKGAVDTYRVTKQAEAAKDVIVLD